MPLTQPHSITDTIEMAEASVREIEGLRAANATLAPKAHAYDTITTILGLLPQPSQGYAEDLTWKLKRRIEELRAEHERTAGATAPPPGQE